MGNALRFLCGSFQKPEETAVSQQHGDAAENIGVSVLERDLHHFHKTSQVPPGLSQYVSSSKEAQARWYNKLWKPWNEARPHPKQPEAAAKLVIQTLKDIGEANLEGFLAFYGLPFVPQTAQEDIKATPLWPEGVQFELLTLPIYEKNIGDGDGFIAYVSTKEARELNLMPQEVKDAIKRREKARAVKNFAQANLVYKDIIAAGYRFIKLPNQQKILARKYRIRLRGVDAPEGEMPYGEEAKQMLVKLIQGKRLNIHVYEEDQFGRWVGDVYCDGIFIQEQLLKRGCAWHFPAYDRRPQFAMWENEARADRRGLWALPNPEKPWVWRKKNPNPRDH